MPIRFAFKKLNDLGTVFRLAFGFFWVITQNVTVAAFPITNSYLLGVEIVFGPRGDQFGRQWKIIQAFV